MKKLTTLLFLTFLATIKATILNVNIDGSMDYTIVQEAVNAATNGDTILVHPGTYHGAIKIEEKYITLASLYLFDPQDEYIGTTILKGIPSESVVFVAHCQTDTVTIEGFTITGGGGSNPYPNNGVFDYCAGGGILSYQSNMKIRNNIIKRNSTYGFGGGIWCRQSSVILSGNSILENSSIMHGGVIVGSYSTSLFDAENLNSIYNNNGVQGSDLYLGFSQSILLDSISVLPFKQNEILWNPDFTTINLEANYAAFEEIDADLFVSNDGDDNNDGLSWETALKTISYAARRMKSNYENPNTIHIAEGVYTDEQDNRNFPICYKEAVNIIGEGEVKLTADNYEFIFYPGYYDDHHKLLIENIDIETNHDEAHPLHLLSGYPESMDCYVNLKNIRIQAKDSFILLKNNFDISNFTIENSNTCLRIENTLQGQPFELETNIHNFISKNNTECSLSLTAYQTPARFKITNALIADNRYFVYGEDASWMTAYNIFLDNASDVTIANSTIINNRTSSNLGAGAVGTSGFGTNLELINCLFSNNSPRDINIKSSPYGTDYASVDFCLFDSENTTHVGTGSILEIGQNNVYGEPELMGENEVNPFMPSEFSPAVDAGTLDYPADMEVPEYDLAGNPRVYGNGIDIGAYEWDGTVSEEDIVEVQSSVHIYPNPIVLRNGLRSNTVIELDIREAGQVEVGIYNLRGQKVKTLIDATMQPSTFELYWNGKGDNGKLVASGQYFCKIKTAGQVIAKKMMIIK